MDDLSHLKSFAQRAHDLQAELDRLGVGHKRTDIIAEVDDVRFQYGEDGSLTIVLAAHGEREIGDIEILFTADQVETLRRAMAPKWISVEERLPEFGETVLVWWLDRRVGFVDHAILCKLTSPIGRHPAQWWPIYKRGHADLSAWIVTHWMPLPEPPAEDSHA